MSHYLYRLKTSINSYGFCFEKLNDEQKNTFTGLAEVLYVNDEKVFP